MTKVISVFVIVLVLYGGWELFLYWEKVRDEKESSRKAATAAQVVPEQLPGMPYTLEPTLQAAQKGGAAGLKNWLRQYRSKVTDPRLAWIELDYVVLVARDDPAEARRVFAGVKQRTTPASPVYERVKQLEKTYE
ncbi:MAG: hypothetical protein HY298_11200 [Verrucomicrobia bacterium]|nr:hypothetical protein [Verrucomicrobiota bacterium]